MTQSRTINSIVFQFQVKFSPSAQLGSSTDSIGISTHINGLHAYVKCGGNIGPFTQMHRPERRKFHQRTLVSNSIDNLLYQPFLKTDHQIIGSKISRQKTPARHRIDGHASAPIISLLCRKMTGSIFLNECLHQLRVTGTQAAIQHLIQFIVGLVKAYQHPVHLGTQPMRRIIDKRLEVFFQISKKVGNV